jgi:type IV secretion system protein VirB11
MTPSAIDLHDQRDRRLRDKLRRELGPEVSLALADASVVEVMLNADSELWVERLGSGVARLGGTMCRSQAENLLGTVAALAETEINEGSPLLEVELPFDGSRFHGVVPPVSRLGGHPKPAMRGRLKTGHREAAGSRR